MPFLCMLLLAAAPTVEHVTGFPDIETHKLANGLTVVLWPDPSAAEVSAQVWYRVGALHERPGLTGMAHLFEHMMMRPSKFAPEGGLMFTRTMGAEVEANAYFRSTSFRITVAPENLPAILRFHADTMINLPVDPVMLKVEKEAVRSEYLNWDNSPMLRLLPQLAAITYPNHPAQFFLTGKRADLDEITTPDCVKFYKDYYAPNNAILVLAGRFDPTATLEVVERTFGPLPRTKDIALPPDLKKLPKASAITAQVPSDIRPFVFTYPIPFATLDARQDGALQMAWRILFEGETSLVGDAMIRVEHLTGRINSNFSGLGWRFVTLDLADGAGQEALKTIDAAVASIQKLDETAYQRFAFANEADLLRQLQNPATRAQVLGFYLIYRKGLAALRNDLTARKSIALKDVKAAAAKYLSSANRQAVIGVGVQ